MSDERPGPARRFVIAQSWWIAGELARRHPDLLLIETHPGGGMYDCLTLLDSDTNTTLIQLNRSGSLRAGVHTGVASWHDVLAADDAHTVVKLLERSAELPTPASSPVTTPRTLTYRLLARVLTTLVDDGHAWDARNGQLDSSDDGAAPRPELQRFPSVVEGLRERRRDDLHGAPAYRYWLLLRDHDPVAVLDTDGRLHQRDRPSLELLPTYRGTNSSLTATMGKTMGHLLP